MLHVRAHFMVSPSLIENTEPRNVVCNWLPYPESISDGKQAHDFLCPK
jgi:hypothetical protein